MSRANWMLTAFEPFDGRERNLSAEILSRVRDSRIQTRLFPVVFDALSSQVASALDARPSAFVLMGESKLSDYVHVERIALNILDAGDRPDNSGMCPEEHPVMPGGPLAVEATWDADRVVRVLSSRGIRAKKSYHAGCYACNQALYLALTLATARSVHIPIGFLHVPGQIPSPEIHAEELADAMAAVFSEVTRDGQ